MTFKIFPLLLPCSISRVVCPMLNCNALQGLYAAPERWSIVHLLYTQLTCVEKALFLSLKEPLLSLWTTKNKISLSLSHHSSEEKNTSEFSHAKLPIINWVGPKWLGIFFRILDMLFFLLRSCIMRKKYYHGKECQGLATLAFASNFFYTNWLRILVISLM